ncbi:outer membrane beta-barrel protein [Chryseosolibacter indicus]|uniref:Outer membrane protein beta-barrel domain-containing protein n=1 Tax=Chryseosolibacter indicus TaxID=2782351 RepID=A0ABS5VKA4_9BACT|nr:outer membrane beta-barrel protein [Chryseosolibacter indicus]MBT1701863.1 hypothetical protein [Chryseosolibacter indicus]
MKKVLLSIIAVVAITSASFAQGRASLGLELNLPMGDFGDVVGLGIGGTVRYEGKINENLNWLGTAGYVSFLEKDDSGFTASIIPIQGGVKYYFNESFNGFYGGAELGAHIVSAKFGDESDSETKFGFAPSVGYHLGNIDISARYQIISDADFVGFRLAYVFGSAE